MVSFRHWGYGLGSLLIGNILQTTPFTHNLSMWHHKACLTSCLSALLDTLLNRVPWNQEPGRILHIYIIKVTSGNAQRNEFRGVFQLK